MTTTSQFVVHNAEGLQYRDGNPTFGQNSSSLSDIAGKIKAFTTSQCGTKLAWIHKGEVCVAASPSWQRIGTLKHPRAQEIKFSPKGSYLAVWDTYIKSEGQSTPNLSVYDVNAKKLLKAFFQQSQVNWHPQWTDDECLFSRNVTNEVHFYKSDDLHNISEKKVLPKVRSFSLSPSVDTHYVTFFVPSLKGAPSYVHIYRYPDFADTSKALANKSFYKVDSIETFWNRPCTGVLLLTTAEMDKSGQSYYGEQMLYYMTILGESIRVTFSKEGNIRSVAWCPNGKEFFAVYGSSPARTTLFNNKCDAVAEFGEGARNTVLVNPVGNIVMIGGFGNISSRFELFNIATRKEINKKDCSDITHIEWSPCGQYLLTSTCTPRLRVNNGYKIWHYTAALVYEHPETELFNASWLPDPSKAQPFNISYKKVEEIESEVKTASTQRYIPPSQRAAMASKGTNVATPKRFLSQQDSSTNISTGTPGIVEVPLSKSALKNKKKREAARKKKEEGEENNEEAVEKVEVELTGDPEKDKKLRNIKRKLDSITKLKLEKAAGKTLEKNQLEKISTETKLIEELKQLNL